MYILGENIHIISEKVKEALIERNAIFFQDLAVRQVEAGALALDLNLGQRKKDGAEVFPWIVDVVQAVVDVPRSFDSTNLLGIEAGLKRITKAQPIINSTSAEPERLEKVPLLAKAYNTKLIALTMGSSGIPVGADERVNIALEKLIPRMLEIDFPMSDLIIDPLVLTVSGCQQYCPHLIETVRTLQYGLGSRSNHLCGSIQCLQRGARRTATAHQPHLLRHVNGRRVADDDREPNGHQA